MADRLLEQIPYIGRSLSQSIKELAETGDLGLLQRLSIDVSPEDIFTTVPGIGQVLARRLYRGLGLRSLADLEQAAKTGQLAGVPGFGKERIAYVQASVTAMLQAHPQTRQVKQGQLQQEYRRSHPVLLTQTLITQTPTTQAPTAQTLTAQTKAPPVALLLEVDQQYRYLAKAGQLRMITPKRFNPENKPWLPVMHLNKAGWQFNVLYSNTARSHELGKTNDWVVIHYERDGEKGQCTIVTETRGERKGDRVVRGETAIAA